MLTEKPVATESSLERQLGHIDFFEQAVVVDSEGNVIAAIGAEPESILGVANLLRALMEDATCIGAPLTCELTCDGRTFFGVLGGKRFALLAPTRRDMTTERLAAVLRLLIDDGGPRGDS